MLITDHFRRSEARPPSPRCVVRSHLSWLVSSNKLFHSPSLPRPIFSASFPPCLSHPVSPNSFRVFSSAFHLFHPVSRKSGAIADHLLRYKRRSQPINLPTTLQALPIARFLSTYLFTGVFWYTYAPLVDVPIVVYIGCYFPFFLI